MGGPLGGGVLRHVEVHDPAPGVSEDDEDEQDPERHRGHHEEVDGHEFLHVVVEEGPPGWRRRFLGLDHVPLDRCLRHVDAQLGEFPDDAPRAPARVGARHLADEVLDRLGQPGSAGPWSGEAGPVVAKPPALPSDDGARLDEDQGIAPAGPGPGQPRPEQSIGNLGAGPGRAPPVDSELVAQRDGLELEDGARSEAGPEEDARRARRTAFMRAASYPTSAAPSGSRRRQPTLRATSVMTGSSGFSGRTGRPLSVLTGFTDPHLVPRPKQVDRGTCAGTVDLIYSHG